ncbi:RNA-directed DNA polymerase, eukaryota [Tanacetum coccineum]
MGSQRSKEDDVNRISISIFVSNFPDSFSAKELFQTCKQYGHVVDSFIPQKRTKEGKRFGFVRFINVFNVERLVNNLCTIWVGRLKLHANLARFQRAPLNKEHKPVLPKGAVHRNVVNSSRPISSGNFGSAKSYVNVVKNVNEMSKLDSPAIVLDDDCVLSKDLSNSLMGRIKEFASLTNLKNAMMNEGFVDLNVKYIGELWVLLEFSSIKSKEAFRDNVGVSSWFSELRQASLDINPDGRIVWVDVEGVPLKLWTMNTFKRIANKWGDLIDTDGFDDNYFHSKRLCLFTKSISNIYENFKITIRGKVYWIRAKEVPGWIPDLVEDLDDEELSDDDISNVDEKNLDDENCEIVKINETIDSNVMGEMSVNGSEEVEPNGDPVFFNNNNSKADDVESVSIGQFKKSEAPRSGGSFICLMEEVVKVGQTMGYNMDGVVNNLSNIIESHGASMNKVNFLAIQETKMEEIDLFSVRRCWGNSVFDHLHSNSVDVKEFLLANLKKELRLVDEVIDKGACTEEDVIKRMDVLTALRNIDHIHSMDLAQKAKIKWSIEGDEISKNFHGILNKKRNQMNIRGIMVDGVWNEQPNDVKREFLKHFRQIPKTFGSGWRASIDMGFPKTISDDQCQDLE